VCDGAFLVFAGKGDFNVEEALARTPRIALIPFDSKRWMMTSIHRTSDRKVIAYCKGAPDEILSKSTHILLEDRHVVLDNARKAVVARQLEDRPPRRAKGRMLDATILLKALYIASEVFPQHVGTVTRYRCSSLRGLPFAFLRLARRSMRLPHLTHCVNTVSSETLCPAPQTHLTITIP
jgi:hypothetical protein